MKKKEEKDEEIDETNFREYAQKAIKNYSDKNMMVDVLFWGHVIGLYERAMAKLAKGVLDEEDKKLLWIIIDYYIERGESFLKSDLVTPKNIKERLAEAKRIREKVV